MNKLLVILCYLSATFISSNAVADFNSEPEKDRVALVKYFKELLPEVEFKDHNQGLYAFNEEARKQAEEINIFPPFDFELEEGEKIYNTPFANGKTYASCIESGLLKSRDKYPYFDTNTKQVKTFELEINECREANNEKPFDYYVGEMASLSGYLAKKVEGHKFNVQVPTKEALQAYQKGKEFYYSKRGYLNSSCADCHIFGATKKSRGETLHQTLGDATGWPTYRLAWGHLGTLHHRIDGCIKFQQAKPLKAQGETYRAIEYFMSYMSNGLELNAPSVRK